jgi:hypothetical protein
VIYAAPFAMAAYYFNQSRNYTQIKEIPNNIFENWKNKKILEKDLDENKKFLEKKIEKNKPSLIVKRPNITTHTSTETIEKVAEDLKEAFYTSLKLAFSGDFSEALNFLQNQKTNLESDLDITTENREKNRILNPQINLVKDLREISTWQPLTCPENFEIQSYKVTSNESAKKSWAEAMALAAKTESRPINDICSLIEIGLKRRWFQKEDQANYENILDGFYQKINHNIEGMKNYYVISRAYQNLILPEKAKKSLENCSDIIQSILSEEIKTFEEDKKHELDNLIEFLPYLRNMNDDSTSKTVCQAIFKILKETPLKKEEYLTIIKDVLNALPTGNPEAICWGLNEFANIIVDYPGDIRSKIELLLIIQNDLQAIEKFGDALNILGYIQSTLDLLPMLEKRDLVVTLVQSFHKLRRDEATELMSQYNNWIDGKIEAMNQFNASIKLIKEQVKIPIIQGIASAILGCLTFLYHPFYILGGCLAITVIPGFVRR